MPRYVITEGEGNCSAVGGGAKSAYQLTVNLPSTKCQIHGGTPKPNGKCEFNTCKIHGDKCPAGTEAMRMRNGVMRGKGKNQDAKMLNVCVPKEQVLKPVLIIDPIDEIVDLLAIDPLDPVVDDKGTTGSLL